jgi:NIMA (never in mitosis gene a)-related kinase
LDKKKTRNEQLSEKLLISWVMQILMALEYLDEKHIVHRLLTADNIYLNYQGDLKIGSFGKAKQLENTLQKAQTIIG